MDLTSMMSEPTFNVYLTKGRTVNAWRSWSFACTVNWTTFVSEFFSVYNLDDQFNALPCRPSLAARLSDTQELLQAVSHKTNAIVLVPE